MELDDLKKTWNTAAETAGQKKVDVEQMIKEGELKYASKTRKVILPEMLGSGVCFAAAAYIGFQWNLLDTTVLQAAGVLSIILLLVIPAISLWSTAALRQRPQLSQPHAATLQQFAQQKLQFFKLQKWSVVLSYLLLVAIIVLMSGIYGRNDLAENKYFWIFFITIGYIFLMFYSKWVEKYYRKSINGAELLLKEIKI